MPHQVRALGASHDFSDKPCVLAIHSCVSRVCLQILSRTPCAAQATCHLRIRRWYSVLWQGRSVAAPAPQPVTSLATAARTGRSGAGITARAEQWLTTQPRRPRLQLEPQPRLQRPVLLHRQHQARRWSQRHNARSNAHGVNASVPVCLGLVGPALWIVLIRPPSPEISPFPLDHSHSGKRESFQAR